MTTNLSQTTGRKSAKEQVGAVVETVKSAIGFGAEGMDRTKVPPKSAPEKFHIGYYNSNIGRLKKRYKEQGIDLPDYLDSAEDYVAYVKGTGKYRKGKMYGGRVQPRRASSAAETR
jgi:hypothetical protein